MFEVYGTIFIIVIGLLANIMYKKGKGKKFFSIFCTTFENLFEHLKVIVGPTLLWIIIESIFMYDEPNFLISRACAVLIMCICMPLFYYGWNRVTKKNNLELELISFVISVCLGQLVAAAIMICEETPFYINYISLLILVGVLASYCVVLFHKPKKESIVEKIKRKVTSKRKK